MACFEDALLKIAPLIAEAEDLTEYEAMTIPGTPTLADIIEMLLNSMVASIMAGGQDFASEDMWVSSADIKTSNLAVKRQNVLPSDTLFTSPNEPDMATPSMKEDYPNSETIYVDERGTWIKNNKAKGTLDIMHQSGSSLTFQKDGSVIMFVRKDFKQVVDGNYTLEVGNNIDISAGANMRLHSLGEMSIEPDTMVTILSPLMVIKTAMLLENP